MKALLLTFSLDFNLDCRINAPKTDLNTVKISYNFSDMDQIEMLQSEIENSMAVT